MYYKGVFKQTKQMQFTWPIYANEYRDLMRNWKLYSPDAVLAGREMGSRYWQQANWNSENVGISQYKRRY